MQQKLVHKHYIAASNKLQIIENFKGKTGFFIKSFFISDKINGNDWRVTWDAIKQDAQDVVGLPIVLQEDLDHPEFAVQNFYARGVIMDYSIDEGSRRVSVIARIFDKRTKELINAGRLRFVSPAVIPRDSESLEEINGIDVLHRFIPIHLAIVARPAYGTILAKIENMCDGDGDSCMQMLKPKTASVTHPGIAAIAGYIRSRYSKKTIETAYNKAKKADLGDCVSRKISIISDENPDMSHEQVIAIAYSMCRDKSGASIASILGNPDSSSQKVGPLTQTPFIKKKIASQLSYLASRFDQLAHRAPYPVYRGRQGNWIYAKKQWIFVARGESVDKAVRACSCPNSTD